METRLSPEPSTLARANELSSRGGSERRSQSEPRRRSRRRCRRSPGPRRHAGRLPARPPAWVRRPRRANRCHSAATTSGSAARTPLSPARLDASRLATRCGIASSPRSGAAPQRQHRDDVGIAASGPVAFGRSASRPPRSPGPPRPPPRRARVAIAMRRARLSSCARERGPAHPPSRTGRPGTSRARGGSPARRRATRATAGSGAAAPDPQRAEPAPPRAVGPVNGGAPSSISYSTQPSA